MYACVQGEEPQPGCSTWENLHQGKESEGSEWNSVGEGDEIWSATMFNYVVKDLFQEEGDGDSEQLLQLVEVRIEVIEMNREVWCCRCV